MADSTGRAVALGLFDGMHTGHRKIVNLVLSWGSQGLIPSVFTIKSDTVEKKNGESFEYIYTEDYKERLIKDLGDPEIFSEDFRNIKNMTGDEFVRLVLKKKLNISLAVCGKDFRFGKDAAWGCEELEKFGEKYDFDVETADDVVYSGVKISSQRIRKLLLSGSVGEAGALLGEPYTISGEIIHGRETGRKLGYPTINLRFEPGQLVPAHGVYISETETGGEFIPSVTDIGVKPTVGGSAFPAAETHILNFSGDLYGKSARVRLKHFLRPEKKFGSLEELKSAIFSDTERCKEYFKIKE